MEPGVGTDILPKMHFSGTVVRTTLAGAVVDLGGGLQALLHVSQIVHPANETFKSVEDVLKPGDTLEVWVRRVNEGRVELTMKEPLALEWRDLKKDMLVKGKVVRLEKFGAFVEIGAERPGLIHISEMAHGYVRAPEDVVKEGDEVEAQIVEVDRKKKQIRLSMKVLQPEPEVVETSKPASKEKPERRKPGPRGEGRPRRETEQALVEETPTEPEPTAMEIALRQAMDKANARKPQTEKKRVKIAASANDDILTRTLENKVKTG